MLFNIIFQWSFIEDLFITCCRPDSRDTRHTTHFNMATKVDTLRDKGQGRGPDRPDSGCHWPDSGCHWTAAANTQESVVKKNILLP